MNKFILAIFILLFPVCAIGATDVYYSVSPFGTGNLETGAGTVAVSSGVATFSVAQTGNIGVGDHVLSAGVDGFISVMTNSTTATLVTALGAAHGDVSAETLTSIAHEYASLSAAEAGFTDANHTNNTDLTAADIVVNISCYFDHDDSTVDSSPVVVNFGTTDSTRFVRFYTPQGGTESINNQRHLGVFDNTKYFFRLNEGGGNAFDCQEQYTEFIGLQVEQFGNSAARDYFSLSANSGGTLIEKCLIFGTSSTSSSIGINVNHEDAIATFIANNIIYDFPGNGIIHSSASASIYVYNCTITDCAIGINGSFQNHLIVKNTCLFGNTDGYDDGGASSFDYTAYDEGSDPGTNGVDISGDAGADLFLDYTGNNFHGLDTSSSLYHAGTDLDSDANLPIIDDIDGDTRHASTPSIGADEFENAPTATRRIMIISSLQFNPYFWGLN